jgi:hypothetical protein
LAELNVDQASSISQKVPIPRILLTGNEGDSEDLLTRIFEDGLPKKKERKR